jgi:antitoxin HigA-1
VRPHAPVTGIGDSAGRPEYRRLAVSWSARASRNAGRSASVEISGSPLGGSATRRWISILRTTIKETSDARKNGRPPVHPGEIIKEDVLPGSGLSVAAAARALGVSRQLLHDILAEKRPLSAVMCLKLARLFGGSPEVWMRLQASYDLKRASQDEAVMARVRQIVPMQMNEATVA